MPDYMILMATKLDPTSLSGISPLENLEVGDSVMIDLVVGMKLLGQ